MSTKSWNNVHLVRLLSTERMGTYITATDGNLENAFALYAWNSELTAKLQAVTGMVEVITRNAIDHVLTEWTQAKDPDADWFDLSIFSARTRDSISLARRRVSHSTRVYTHGKVVAELSFGFWRSLTSKKYLTSLWIPALYQSFPNGHANIRKRQEEVTRLLGNMNFVRNRAAHLEPMFRRDIRRDIADARKLMGWIDPQALAWFEDSLDVDSVLISKPDISA